MEQEIVSSALHQLFDGTRQLIDLGGPVVLVLLMMSVVGLAIFLYKFFQLFGLGGARLGGLQGAITQWQSGDQDKARQALQKSSSRFSDDVLFGLEQVGHAEEEALYEELGRRGALFVQPYGRFLRVLEMIYYLAPLLGLLGTVLGMIDAFRGLEASGGQDRDSTALAGGIWEALLTTAVGLSIAIPFAVAHSWLEARYDRGAERVSDLIARVMGSRVIPSRV